MQRFSGKVAETAKPLIRELKNKMAEWRQAADKV
jgi:hypothetical protein